MATIRQARAAIVRGADLTGWPRPDGPDVAETVRGLSRILRDPSSRRRPSTPRPWRQSGPPPSPPHRTRGGHTETAEHARRRGLVDVALASVMRDGLLGLRDRRPALGGRGAGRGRQRPHPDRGV